MSTAVGPSRVNKYYTVYDHPMIHNAAMPEERAALWAHNITCGGMPNQNDIFPALWCGPRQLRLHPSAELNVWILAPAYAAFGD
jgi:hypothetical protein